MRNKANLRAIILAAGVGRRLTEVHSEPKAMLVFGGRSLIARHIDCLRQLGVSSIVVCVGYRSEQLLAHLASLQAGVTLDTVFNPDFARGSMLSLWSVRQHLRWGGDVLLMDADVLYPCRLLHRLIEAEAENCFLLDRAFEPDEEAVKLCIANGRAVEFRKQLPDALAFDFYGESVGFFRFGPLIADRLARRTQQYHADGAWDAPYEEAIRDLLLDSPEAFAYADISGIPWIEIDFPEDIERARAEVLPKIDE